MARQRGPSLPLGEGPPAQGRDQRGLSRDREAEAGKDPESRQWVTVGEILGLYGVRGGLRLFSFLEHPPDLLGYPRLWLARPAGHEPRRLEAGHQQGRRLIGFLEGIGDRESARELLGTPLRVPRQALEDPGEDEYLWADLVGLEVRSPDGTYLGQVTGLMETGANDVLVVRDGRRERLIPFLAETVLGVYPERGILRTDWDPDF